MTRLGKIEDAGSLSEGAAEAIAAERAVWNRYVTDGVIPADIINTLALHPRTKAAITVLRPLYDELSQKQKEDAAMTAEARKKEALIDVLDGVLKNAPNADWRKADSILDRYLGIETEYIMQDLSSAQSADGGVIVDASAGTREFLRVSETVSLIAADRQAHDEDAEDGDKATAAGTTEDAFALAMVQQFAKSIATKKGAAQRDRDDDDIHLDWSRAVGASVGDSGAESSRGYTDAAFAGL
jgi:hypothetical protein